MQNEATIVALYSDKPVGTLSVHCVTCHGPNVLSAVRSGFSFHRCAVRQCLQHAVCSLLIIERTPASTRGGATFCSTPGVLHTGTLPGTVLPPS